MNKFNHAFWQWFGKSKVVDDDGWPLVVYHGTGDSFSVFHPDIKGRGAFFFSPSHAFAEGFAHDAATSIDENGGYNEDCYGAMESAGAIIMPVYLSLQNPFQPWNIAHVEALVEEAGFTFTEEIKSAWMSRFSSGLYDELEEYLDLIKNLGFDGFYEKEDRSQDFWNIGVFNRTQIKSSIGNYGFYDPTDPDICH